LQNCKKKKPPISEANRKLQLACAEKHKVGQTSNEMGSVEARAGVSQDIITGSNAHAKLELQSFSTLTA
jgi:hypothetical protein